MQSVEIVGGFDYSTLSETIAISIQRRLERMCQLYRQSVYDAIETGLELLAIKQELVEDRVYRRWLESEFPWGKSTANRLENVALRFANVPNVDKVDLSALHILAAPSTPDAVREKAIALIQSGERVSHERAKALKNGGDILTLESGKQVTVESGAYQGQTVTVRPGAPTGLVNVSAPNGTATLLISELMQSEATAAAPQTKPQTPNHVAAIASELEIERDRCSALESVLRQICVAARAGQLTDKLLSEAEGLID